MVKVLSFDVGIINLAYCIFDSLTLKIVHWEIITLDNTAANYSKLYICTDSPDDKFFEDFRRNLKNIEIIQINILIYNKT